MFIPNSVPTEIAGKYVIKPELGFWGQINLLMLSGEQTT